MYVKKESLRYEKNIDLDDTFKFDELPESGKSAGLLLTVRSPIGGHFDYARDGDKLRLVDWFNKVQVVVNGKRPLKDINGAVAQALEYWNKGNTSPDRMRSRPIGEAVCFIPLAWGRFLGDTQYYLNWEDYQSMELDLTNVLTDPPFPSATLTIENYKIMDEGALPASLGVFQERIWREWTTVKNETQYFKLPIGPTLRRIILRAVPAMTAAAPYHRKRSFYHLMEEIKLGFNSHAEIAFDGYGQALMEQNIHDWPHMPRTEGIALGHSTGYPIRTGIGERRSLALVKGEVATTLVPVDFGAWTYTDDIINAYSDPLDSQYVWWMCNGLGYNNTMAILFDLYGMDNLINTEAKKPINLDIKTENHDDAVGGINEIILSELVAK